MNTFSMLDLYEKFPFLEIDPPVNKTAVVHATPLLQEIKIPDNALIFRITKALPDAIVCYATAGSSMVEDTDLTGAQGQVFVDSPRWIPCEGRTSIFIGGDNALCSIEFYIGGV